MSDDVSISGNCLEYSDNRKVRVSPEGALHVVPEVSSSAVTTPDTTGVEAVSGSIQILALVNESNSVVEVLDDDEVKFILLPLATLTGLNILISTRTVLKSLTSPLSKRVAMSYINR